MSTTAPALSTVNPDAVITSKHNGGHILHTQASSAEQFPAQFDSIRLIPAQGSSLSFGNFIDFFIQPSDISILENAFLQLAVSSISVSAGSSPYFTNDAYNWISRYEITVGNQTGETIYPEAPYTESLYSVPNEVKNRLLRIRSNNTSANLITAAASAQTVYINLRGFFNVGRGFVMGLLNAPLKIRVYLNTLSSIIEGTGIGSATITGSITSANLVLQGKDLSNNTPLLNSIISQRKSLAGGFSQVFLTPVQQRLQSIASGTTSFSFTLSSFVGKFSHIAIILRLQSDLTTAGSQTYTNYQSVDNFAIKDSNGSVVSVVNEPTPYVLNALSTKYFPGDFTDINGTLGGVPKYVFVQSFSSRPVEDLKNGSQSGYYTFNALQTLNLYWNTATSSALYCDVIGYRYTKMTVDSTGNAVFANL